MESWESNRRQNCCLRNYAGVVETINLKHYHRMDIYIERYKQKYRRILFLIALSLSSLWVEPNTGIQWRKGLLSTAYLIQYISKWLWGAFKYEGSQVYSLRIIICECILLVTVASVELLYCMCSIVILTALLLLAQTISSEMGRWCWRANWINWRRQLFWTIIRH